MTDLMNVLYAALLPVVAGLLLEELTFGGLVRLLLAPRPKASTCGARKAGKPSLPRGRTEPKKALGGARCSH